MSDYSSYYATGKPREPDAWEVGIVDWYLRGFSQATAYRNQAFASHWEEVAELVAPEFRNTFVFGNYNTPGQKKTDRQVDSTGQMAGMRFAAICDSLLTPRNMIYQRLVADDEYVMKDRATRLYFEQLTRLLFHCRYAPEANFASQNNSNFKSLGYFGNMGMFIDKLDDPYVRGLRYKAVPLGEIFVLEDHQGRVIAFFRWMRLTAAQANTMWPGQLPPQLVSAYQAQSPEFFDFIHCVSPRDDYDPQSLDAKRHRWRSCYVSMNGRMLMAGEGEPLESGYNTFPLAFGRYEQGPGEVYGRGWAMMVLPALKTLNAEKRMFLKQGHRAADPVLLVHDDGIVGMSLRPGAINPGGVNSDGKPLVHALPTGEIQVSKEMMQEERTLINDAGLVTLFQILVKTPQMSATEVIERANEKGILLAPTMGRQQSEYIGPMTDRELDVLRQLRLLPQPPPRLVEAQRAGGGRVKVVYDNPLSRMAKAQESSGFLRTLESVHQIAANTGDVSVYDPFDFPVAVPAMASQNAVPESWMASAEKMAAKAKARAQAQQAEQKIKAMPNQAAMIKAQAVAAKAGQPVNGEGQQ